MITACVCGCTVSGIPLVRTRACHSVQARSSSAHAGMFTRDSTPTAAALPQPRRPLGFFDPVCEARAPAFVASAFAPLLREKVSLPTSLRITDRKAVRVVGSPPPPSKRCCTTPTSHVVIFLPPSLPCFLSSLIFSASTRRSRHASSPETGGVP